MNNNENLSEGLNEKKSSFFSIFGNSKKKKIKKIEDADIQIYDSVKENQKEMINILSSINFSSSALPKKILETRRSPNQKYCDLEMSARSLRAKLENAPEITDNISEDIDKYLIGFSLLFKEAVISGKVKTAYACQDALNRCIMNIRNVIPQVPESYRHKFIESGNSYLQQWNMLINLYFEADQERANLKKLEEKREADRKRLENKKDDLFNKISKDEDYSRALINVMDRRGTDDISSVEREVRNMLVEQLFAEYSFNFTDTLSQSEMSRLAVLEGQIDMLNTKICIIPSPRDPEQFEKFTTIMRDLVDDLAKTDTYLDSVLTDIEEIEKEIETINNSPGAVHLKTVKEKYINENVMKQEKTVRSSKEELFKKYNIHSDDEMRVLLNELNTVANDSDTKIE